jgi:uncharacterized protein (TIGR03083 family)
MAVETDPGRWLTAVRRSHDRLTAQVEACDILELERGSFCSEWTIAQVLSHLGSQAEIFSLFVDAGLAGANPPGQEAFVPIWDDWNARDPEDQAADSLTANEALVTRIEGLAGDKLSAFQLDLFGTELDAAGLLRMRLSEHAVHAWDIAVALDPTVRLLPDAVLLLIDGLPEMTARVGTPAALPATFAVTTSDPLRRFVLATDSLRLEPDVDEPIGGTTDGSIDLPAEVLVRLVYGRLRPDESVESVESVDVSIQDLRALFPGF